MEWLRLPDKDRTGVEAAGAGSEHPIHTHPQQRKLFFIPHLNVLSLKLNGTQTEFLCMHVLHQLLL